MASKIRLRNLGTQPDLSAQQRAILAGRDAAAADARAKVAALESEVSALQAKIRRQLEKLEAIEKSLPGSAQRPATSSG